MRRRLCITALALLLGSVLPAAGINSYRRYDVRSGLSDNSVKDICQDKNGYMWFATKDGLNRFDGHQFDVFGSSLTGDLLNIDVILPHSDGIRIWVGSTQSLMLFDPRDESFVKFDMQSGDGAKILNSNSLFYDLAGNLWIGSEKGLFQWDEQSRRLIRLDLHDSCGESCNIIRSIFGNNQGDIWIGTIRGLFRYDRSARNNFSPALRPNPESTLMGDNEITAIVQIEEDKLLIGTQNGHLAEFDIGTGKFKGFPAISTDGKRFSVTRIHTIFRKSGNIYMIGSDSGLFFFNRADGSWLSSGDDLAEESVYQCFRDREGGLWIGTFFCGVNYLSPRQNEIRWYYDDGHPESLKGNAVSQFCEDSKGNLWIATENGGLNYFDVRNSTFTDYTSRSHNNLHALCIDGNDLWIGTFSRGLDRMDLRTGQIVNYRNVPEDPASLCNDYVYVILKASDGTLYIGTMGGLCTFDKQTQKFSKVDFTGDTFIYDILEDRDGNIWIAGRVNGIYRYSPAKKEWKNYRHNDLDPSSPPGNRLIRVYMDSEGRIWFCGECDGICRYRPESDSFESFGVNEGLPNSVYYGILDDGAGNLWLSSNQGIIKYNPGLRTHIRYTTEDGLQSNQFNFRSSFKAADGTFYFGGINGFNQFSPFNISVNKNKPNIVISSVSMHDSDKVSSDSEHRMIPTENLGSLEIPSETISFDIHYECLSFVAPGQNRYAWKLDGFNDEWVYTDQHSVSFMKLPAGRYTFLVRGCNNDGYWSDTTCSLDLAVLPHPFLSPFAKTLYLLIAFGLTVLVVRIILRRQDEKKEKKLIEAKINFFTQIVHEIKTPVTLIKSPLENVLETGKWNSSVAANLNIMKRNVDRLLELIRQLLDFRKIGDEGFRLRCSETDIRLLIDETVTRFRASAGPIGLSTEYPDTPMRFCVDGEALTKILSNLLTNALKFARTTIRISLRDLSDERDRKFRISVSDDGPGIPASSRKKVFEAFYQENPRSGQGFGIGLSLVKLLVEKHNGHISIGDSLAEGGGCEISVEIPDMRSAENGKCAVASPEETITETSTEEEPAESKKHCIMIVEDTADMREFLVKNFEEHYRILPAQNGIEALKILQKQACDLIVSDILMPGMDGFELLVKVRRDEMLSHIPFILLSAIDSVDSKIKGLEIGADAYIEKPFSLSYIRATVESLIENRERAFRHFASEPNLQYDKGAIGSGDRAWLDKVTGIISENLMNEGLSVDLLVEQMALSRSSLQRKLKGLTGTSPNEYIQLVRLKTAAQMLRQGELRINEICYLTGFSSMSWFAKCFSKQFGMRPKDYMKYCQSQNEAATDAPKEGGGKSFIITARPENDASAPSRRNNGELRYGLSGAGFRRQKKGRTATCVPLRVRFRGRGIRWLRRSGRWRQPSEWRRAPGKRPGSASYPSRRGRCRWQRYRWRKSSPGSTTRRGRPYPSAGLHRRWRHPAAASSSRSGNS